MPPSFERLTCRMCSGAQLSSVLQLTPTPPANAFQFKPGPATTYPLELMHCAGCGHVQLRHVVDPEVLFKDYAYVSGTSPVFIQHFEDYARSCVERLRLQPESLVVEMGSNDATLLKAFRAQGMDVYGVEPAENLARLSRNAGIPTLAAFFTSAAAAVAREENRGRLADLIVANNVLAHIDDLDVVLAGVKFLLAPEGALVFEVQYAEDFVAKGLFDMTYHEHLDVHAVTPWGFLLGRHGLALHDAQRVPTHGGSIRLTAKRVGVAKPTAALEELLREEQHSGILAPGRWKALQGRVEQQKQDLLGVLSNLKGRRVVGFGAPAKATTLLYHFGLTEGVLEYVVDDSPLKQGLYLPGTSIPVVSSSALYDEERGWPDYVLVLAWNFAESIIQKHLALTERGTHFIVPLPALNVTA